jgi:hypothetical protein
LAFLRASHGHHVTCFWRRHGSIVIIYGESIRFRVLAGGNAHVIVASPLCSSVGSYAFLLDDFRETEVKVFMTSHTPIEWELRWPTRLAFAQRVP